MSTTRSCLLKFKTVLNVSVRNISIQRSCQEIKIPVSAGYIAGKWWGPQDTRPIVAFHGWQDNCGTFDTLIPYLPDHIPILALDSPGHGHSYQNPPGMPYHSVNASILIKQLIKYFGWSKISLMGHSLGAIISFTYSFLFPKEVDFVICLDGLQPLVNPRKMGRVSKSIEEFIKYEELNKNTEEPPSYTFQEMEQRLHHGTRKSINLDTAKYILTRNIAPSKTHPGKFYFKRDARLKVGPLEVPDGEEMKRCAAKVAFPIFLSKSQGSSFVHVESMENSFWEMYDILKTSSRDCRLHQVPGTHHAHLNEPETLEGPINDFIKQHCILDRSGGGMKPEMRVNGEEYTMHKVAEI